MPTTSLSNNKRIAKNTIFLYFRTFLTMAISIFTSRIVLETLGVEDFGIYNIVGGFVAMFSLLSGSLTAASQRFISFELGKEKSNESRIFSITLTIHITLAAIIFILLESIGIWFLNTHMNINPTRLFAANCVFQCSIVTFCINLLCIPYNALIIAHEKMNIFAYISIFEAMAKLIIVYLLFLFKESDKLIIYAILLLCISIIIRVIYSTYCNKKFSNCKFHYIKGLEYYKDILSFSGWNFIGSTAGILNTQGINVLINLFFGVTYNAARGIAEQVNTAINSFVLNFMTALNPQITKNYAANNFQYLITLINKGAKYSFFLFWIFSFPVILETEYILDLWLVNVPNHTTIFVRYALIYTMCQALSQTLYTAMLATGEIKKYQIIVGSLSILAFPLAYVFFKLGYPPEYGYIASILLSIICLMARIILLRPMIPGFTFRLYFHETILKILGVSIISTLCAIGIIRFTEKTIYNINGFSHFIITILICSLISCICIYFIGLNKAERIFIKNKWDSKVAIHISKRKQK